MRWKASSPSPARRRLKRSVLHSIVDLQAAINRFIDETKMIPSPLSGPPIATASSRLSNAGSKRQGRSTLGRLRLTLGGAGFRNATEAQALLFAP